MSRFSRILLVAAGVVAAGVNRPAAGDGAGVLLQRSGDRLTLGFDTGGSTPGSQGLGGRAFGGMLGPESLSQVPSFLSLTTPPSGSETLPVGSNVEWDFLPLTTGGATSNLMYWSGDGELRLSPPINDNLTLYDPSFSPATVDGAAAAVAGLRLGTTTSDPLYRLHAHRNWYVAGPDFSLPSEGVYVAAMRVRLDGLLPTLPFFVALGTAGHDAEVFDTVVPWLDANADSLILQGDYNFDGRVDQDDHSVWASQFGSTAPHPITQGEADGNYDGRIDAADYTVWRDALPPRESIAIPEGTASVLASVASALAIASKQRARSEQRTS